METENKLPIEFKTKWLAALRSGEYRQGKYNLFNSENNTYCCLGVAGTINGCDLKLMDQQSIKSSNIYSQLTPKPLQSDIIDSLTILNDGTYNNVGKKSFLEIADWIEANL